MIPAESEHIGKAKHPAVEEPRLLAERSIEANSRLGNEINFLPGFDAPILVTILILLDEFFLQRVSDVSSFRAQLNDLLRVEASDVNPIKIAESVARRRLVVVSIDLHVLVSFPGDDFLLLVRFSTATFFLSALDCNPVKALHVEPNSRRCPDCPLDVEEHVSKVHYVVQVLRSPLTAAHPNVVADDDEHCEHKALD